MASLVHVGVDTDAKGAVVLSGSVRSQKEADKAVSIARATEGVTSVTSTLQIKKDD
jgi:hyperosmotically inducible protein